MNMHTSAHASNSLWLSMLHVLLHLRVRWLDTEDAHGLLLSHGLNQRLDQNGLRQSSRMEVDRCRTGQRCPPQPRDG